MGDVHIMQKKWLVSIAAVIVLSLGLHYGGKGFQRTVRSLKCKVYGLKKRGHVSELALICASKEAYMNFLHYENESALEERKGVPAAPRHAPFNKDDIFHTGYSAPISVLNVEYVGEIGPLAHILITEGSCRGREGWITMDEEFFNSNLNWSWQ